MVSGRVRGKRFIGVGKPQFASNVVDTPSALQQDFAGNARVRCKAMNEAALDHDDPGVLSQEVSDEALEAAAAATPSKAIALTIAYCTGNLDCPF
jgi:hypothetical protein